MNLETYRTPEKLPGGAPARIAKLLGLRVSTLSDDLWLADQVAKGLNTHAADELCKVLGRGQVIGTLIPEATLRRAKTNKKSLSKEMSERLYEVTKVIDAVSTSYRGDTEKIKRFLTAPHQLLDGRSPYEVASSCSAGSDVVLNLVNRADAGFSL